MILGMSVPAFTACHVALSLIGFGPPHIAGVITLIVLAGAVAALYIHHLSGAWRSVYIARRFHPMPVAA